jgi:beta-glucanase (GH16 family)
MISIRSLLITLVLVSACGSETAVVEQDDSTGIPEPEGYRLVWSDEFDTAELSPTKWNHWVTGNPFNNELQYYTRHPQNSRLEDGLLKIIALDTPYTDVDGTRAYSSARINSKGHAEFLYGRFDIRAKLPTGQGMWPAIWMLPTDNVYGGWPKSGEIDIMEMIGSDPSTIHGTLHHTLPNSPDHDSAGSAFRLPAGSFADDFHVFTIEWEETEMRWYVDGEQFRVARQWATDGYAFPAPFNQRFHFLLNLAVGGDWPGSPDATTVFPQVMEVDYVRAYEAVATSAAPLGQ